MHLSMATVMIAEYVEWMGLWYAVMAAHGRITQDVLVSTKRFSPRNSGSVQNVWLTSLGQHLQG
jgi:hypothetical protein